MVTKHIFAAVLVVGSLAAASVSAASADTITKQKVISTDDFGNRISRTRIVKTDDFGNRVSKIKIVKTDAFGDKSIRTRIVHDDF